MLHTFLVVKYIRIYMGTAPKLKLFLRLSLNKNRYFNSIFLHTPEVLFLFTQYNPGSP